MKIRHVFSTPDLGAAQAAIGAAQAAGIDNDDILLVARSDIELESIPNERKEADSDFIPAALRGAGVGGAAGLLAGLVAVVTPVGLTIAGAGALALVGALVGCWASALVGSSLQDPIRRKFHDEIEAGRILVVVDGTEAIMPAVERALVNSGATLLPYEGHTAMT